MKHRHKNLQIVVSGLFLKDAEMPKKIIIFATRFVQSFFA